MHEPRLFSRHFSSIRGWPARDGTDAGPLDRGPVQRGPAGSWGWCSRGYPRYQSEAIVHPSRDSVLEKAVPGAAGMMASTAPSASAPRATASASECLPAWSARKPGRPYHPRIRPPVTACPPLNPANRTQGGARPGLITNWTRIIRHPDRATPAPTGNHRPGVFQQVRASVSRSAGAPVRRQGCANLLRGDPR
jgi:hypothetical protein